MLVFFTMGFVDLVGIASNYVKLDLGLTDSEANIFPSLVFFWFLIFSVPTGMLMNKIGRKKTVMLSLAVTYWRQIGKQPDFRAVCQSDSLFPGALYRHVGSDCGDSFAGVGLACAVSDLYGDCDCRDFPVRGGSYQGRDAGRKAVHIRRMYSFVGQSVYSVDVCRYHVSCRYRCRHEYHRS